MESPSEDFIGAGTTFCQSVSYNYVSSNCAKSVVACGQLCLYRPFSRISTIVVSDEIQHTIRLKC